MIVTENTTLFAERLLEEGFNIDPLKPPTGKFGDSRELSDELIALILSEKKTATCGLLTIWQHYEEPIPKAGDLEIVLNFDNEPVAAIQYTEVEIKPFNEVDAEFARDEGEGDLSYEYWKEAHISFFNRESEALDMEFSETDNLVCLRFRLVGKFVMEM